MSEEEKGKKVEAGAGLLSAIPHNTPRSAIAIAVVMFVAVGLYPVIRNEVELLLKFRQAVSEKQFALSNRELTIRSEGEVRGIDALASITKEHTRAITHQAQQIGVLQEKVNRLEVKLEACETRLESCLGAKK